MGVNTFSDKENAWGQVVTEKIGYKVIGDLWLNMQHWNDGRELDTFLKSVVELERCEGYQENNLMEERGWERSDLREKGIKDKEPGFFVEWVVIR